MSFRNKLLFNIGIALGALVLSSLLMWWVGGRIDGTVEDLNRKRSDEALRTSLLAYLGELRANQEKAREYLPIVQNLLPSKDIVIGLPNVVQTLAVRYGLQGASLAFGAEKTGTATEPGTIAFTLSASGTPTNLIEFMKALEGIKGYVTKMSSVEIIGKERVGYTLSMNGVTYIR